VKAIKPVPDILFRYEQLERLKIESVYIYGCHYFTPKNRIISAAPKLEAAASADMVAAKVKA
jgi:hypothetical protein